jgi:hypothetical protein
VWVGCSRRCEDEEITAVLKQTISVASGCQAARKHGTHMACVGCSVRDRKGQGFVGVDGSDAVTERRWTGTLHCTRRASCLGRGQRRAEG